jgi:protein gp37
MSDLQALNDFSAYFHIHCIRLEQHRWMGLVSFDSLFPDDGRLVMFRPIYQPRTRAREYCDLAVNVYTGCPHGCAYCYARAMAKRFSKPWTYDVQPRPGIVEAVNQQLVGMRGHGKKIMLCFTCDPYPVGFDSTATREVIKAIKESGNHVQILTKGGVTAQRDFDLLDGNDSFGVTFSGIMLDKAEEPRAAISFVRLDNLLQAKKAGLSTWVSCEPVIYPGPILAAIKNHDFIDLWRIGKMNHCKSDIDWCEFGRKVEELCQKHGRNYYIKEDLRKAMEQP